MNPSIELQKQVRDNAEDIRNFVSELRNWEEDMKNKELESRTASTLPVDSPIPPVRNTSKKRDCSESGDNLSLGQTQKAKKRISSADYAAWEKFDVEKACEEVDSSSANSQNIVTETDEEKIQRKNRMRDEANYEKEKGNQFVKKEKWDSAIECYSKAIKCYRGDAIYFCNRAFCYLKKNDYRSAETDCTSALALDSTYVKALHRRGLARTELNQLREAQADFKKAVEIEPNNTALKRDFLALNVMISQMTMDSMEEVINTQLVLNLGLEEEQDPILPAKKHRPILPQSKQAVKQASSRQDWPKIEDAEILEPVLIPAHRRSKKPLKRIEIEEISSTVKQLVSEVVSEISSSSQHKSTVAMSSNQIMSSSTSCVEQDAYKSGGAQHSKKMAVKNPSIQTLPTSLPSILPPLPKNSVQFFAAWRQIKDDSHMCFQYLKIPGARLPTIFQESLDGNTLSEIVEVLVSEFIKGGEHVLEYVHGLANVKRFRTLTMFMTGHDKRNVVKLVDYIKSTEGATDEVVSSIKKDFEI